MLSAAISPWHSLIFTRRYHFICWLNRFSRGTHCPFRGYDRRQRRSESGIKRGEMPSLDQGPPPFPASDLFRDFVSGLKRQQTWLSL